MIMGFRANILDCYTEGTYRVYIQKVFWVPLTNILMTADRE